FIEQENLFKQFTPAVINPQPIPTTYTDTNNWILAYWAGNFAACRNRVKTFECPSATVTDVFTGTGGAVWTPIYGSIPLDGFTSASLVASGGLPGLTNYVPISGCLNRYAGTG